MQMHDTKLMIKSRFKPKEVNMVRRKHMAAHFFVYKSSVFGSGFPYQCCTEIQW